MPSVNGLAAIARGTQAQSAIEKYDLMEDTIEKLNKLDWGFDNAITDEWTHGIHPYPAKFIPQIPRTLIKALSKPGQTVLDPFCGGGTTLVEANVLGRDAVGIDTNPLAILIAKVKTERLNKRQLARLLELAEIFRTWSSEEKGHRALFKMQMREQPEPSIPQIPNLEQWFEKEVRKELGVGRAAIAEIKDSAVRTTAYVALSRIIVRVSNQDSETRYTKRKKDVARGDTLRLLAAAIVDTHAKLKSFQDVRQPGRISLYNTDARGLSKSLAKTSIDLVVTSPPYPNAFDYHLYQRHRLFWLGYEPKEVMKAEIGSHLNYQRSSRNGIEVFAEDMRKVFNGLRVVLSPGAYCCFVIGDSVFEGKVHENSKLLTEIGKEAGLTLVAEINRRLPTSKRSFTTAARRLAYEQILILRNR